MLVILVTRENSLYLRLNVVKLTKSSHFQTTLRVWDVLFYEGANVLFHVALGIFKVCSVFYFGLH